MVLGFLPAYLEVFTQTWSNFWTKFWANLTSLSFLDMLNLFIDTFSRLPFLPILAIIQTLGRTLEGNSRQYRSYVLTGDDVVRLTTLFMREGYLNISQLGNSSIFDIILQWLAGLIWGFVTKSNFLFKLIKLAGISTLEDLVRIFRSSALKQLWLTLVRVVLAYFALGFILALLVMFGLNYHKWFADLRLAQDSKRVWRKKGAVHRQNRKPGSDT